MIKTLDTKTELEMLERNYRIIDFSLKSIEPNAPAISSAMGIKSGEIIKYKSIHKGSIINGDPVSFTFGYSDVNYFVVVKVIHKDK